VTTFTAHVVIFPCCLTFYLFSIFLYFMFAIFMYNIPFRNRVSTFFNTLYNSLRRSLYKRNHGEINFHNTAGPTLLLMLYFCIFCCAEQRASSNVYRNTFTVGTFCIIMILVLCRRCCVFKFGFDNCKMPNDQTRHLVRCVCAREKHV